MVNVVLTKGFFTPEAFVTLLHQKLLNIVCRKCSFRLPESCPPNKLARPTEKGIPLRVFLPPSLIAKAVQLPNTVAFGRSCLLLISAVCIRVFGVETLLNGSVFIRLSSAKPFLPLRMARLAPSGDAITVFGLSGKEFGGCRLYGGASRAALHACRNTCFCL